MVDTAQDHLSYDIYQAPIPWARVHNKLQPLELSPPARSQLVPGRALRQGREVYIGRGARTLDSSFWANPFTVRRYGWD